MFATESAPGLAISGITGGYLLKLIVALGSVLLVFVVLALLTKKFHRYGQSQHRDLSVLSSMSVGTRERLMVVQVGDAQLLLGVTPSRIDNLFVLDTPLHGSGATVAAGKNRADSIDESQEEGQDTQSTSESVKLERGNAEFASTNFKEKLNQYLGKNGPAV